MILLPKYFFQLHLQYKILSTILHESNLNFLYWIKANGFFDELQITSRPVCIFSMIDCTEASWSLLDDLEKSPLWLCDNDTGGCMLLKVDPSVRGVEPAFSVISLFLALQLAIESPILENENMYMHVLLNLPNKITYTCILQIQLD